MQSSPLPPIATQRDFTLDALRGVAALVVVLFHYTLDTGRPDYGLHVGITGVDLFFLISGFVIFMTLSRTKTARDFVVSRFTRLYPTYWACVTLTFGLNALYAARHHTLTLHNVEWYLGNLTMFQHYLSVPDLDAPYWTMIVEMVFYLTMLALFVAGQLRHIERVGSLLTLAAFLVFTVVQRNFPHAYQTIDFLYPLLNHFPLFFAGILFYLIKHDRPTLGRYALLAGCFTASLFVFESLGRIAFLTYPEHVGMLVLYYSLFGLYVNDKLRWVGQRPLVYLGSVSYALYLIHQDVSLSFLRPLLTRVLGDHFWLINTLMLGICLGLASAITYWIERPATRFLKARLLPRSR